MRHCFHVSALSKDWTKHVQRGVFIAFTKGCYKSFTITGKGDYCRKMIFNSFLVIMCNWGYFHNYQLFKFHHNHNVNSPIDNCTRKCFQPLVGSPVVSVSIGSVARSKASPRTLTVQWGQHSRSCRQISTLPLWPLHMASGFASAARRFEKKKYIDKYIHVCVCVC
jgi:hypothetical protein